MSPRKGRHIRRALLDVNTVLALLDPQHVFHDAAHSWAASNPEARWLTCPLVQNGVLRVVGNPAYPNHLGSVTAAREVLAAFCASPRHEFVPDNISLLDADQVRDATMLTPSRVNDLYLLALAIAHDAQLATFDRKLPADAIHGGREAVQLIDA